MGAKLEDIIEAIEIGVDNPFGESRAFVCRSTGEILYDPEGFDDQEAFEPLPDDIEDTSKYVEVPSKADLDLGKVLVRRFAREHLPEEVDEVDAIFRRRGAYSRFKDLLEARGMLERWYEYEENETRQAVLEWCEINGIEVD